MRKFAIILAMVALPVAGQAADSTQTFRQLCMAHAGDTAAIRKAAVKAGFKVMDLGPNVFMGMRDKTDESVQVNMATRHRFECAVTTSSKGNAKANEAAFFGSLGLTPTRRQAKGRIGGTPYTFLYDPKDGEAFVIYAD